MARAGPSQDGNTPLLPRAQGRRSGRRADQDWSALRRAPESARASSRPAPASPAASVGGDWETRAPAAAAQLDRYPLPRAPTGGRPLPAPTATRPAPPAHCGVTIRHPRGLASFGPPPRPSQRPPETAARRPRHPSRSQTRVTGRQRSPQAGARSKPSTERKEPLTLGQGFPSASTAVSIPAWSEGLNPAVLGVAVASPSI